MRNDWFDRPSGMKPDERALATEGRVHGHLSGHQLVPLEMNDPETDMAGRDSQVPERAVLAGARAGGAEGLRRCARSFRLR
jgi:hypothetical protein